MIKEAWEKYFNRKPKAWYCSCYENQPYYGGPEEGGWWGTDTVLIDSERFTSRADAEECKQAISKIVEEWNEAARHGHGVAMAASLDWLDARGLEPDFLPEPDGPSNFFLVVEERPGSMEHTGSRYYE